MPVGAVPRAPANDESGRATFLGSTTSSDPGAVSHRARLRLLALLPILGAKPALSMALSCEITT